MGNAAKGGMEIYTPVHIGCMCYVSYLKVTRWLQHDVVNGFYLYTALEMMQNGLRTSGIG